MLTHFWQGSLGYANSAGFAKRKELCIAYYNLAGIAFALPFYVHYHVVVTIHNASSGVWHFHAILAFYNIWHAIVAISTASEMNISVQQLSVR